MSSSKEALLMQEWRDTDMADTEALAQAWTAAAMARLDERERDYEPLSPRTFRHWAALEAKVGDAHLAMRRLDAVGLKGKAEREQWLKAYMDERLTTNEISKLFVPKAKKQRTQAPIVDDPNRDIDARDLCGALGNGDSDEEEDPQSEEEEESEEDEPYESDAVKEDDDDDDSEDDA
jgi:hypothetical protein